MNTSPAARKRDGFSQMHCRTDNPEFLPMPEGRHRGIFIYIHAP